MANCYSQTVLNLTFISNVVTTQCINTCPAKFYSVTGSVLQCLSACGTPSAYGIQAAFDSVADRCDQSCYYVPTKPFQSGYSCNASCLVATPYYQWFNVSYSVCYTSCPSGIDFAEANDSCVSKCASGFYNIITGGAQTFFCAASCPDYFI